MRQWSAVLPPLENPASQPAKTLRPRGEAFVTETRLTCPFCSEQRALRRSHIRLVDYIALIFKRHPYRCMICNRRFYSGVRPVSEPADS
jgi:transcription elongation factor Elf1